MKHLLLAATLLATPALAQSVPPRPQDPAPPKINCKPFKEVRKVFPDATITKMTSGQFHFLAGAYTIIPPISLPPGDGAVIVSQGKDSFIVWTRGTLACNPTPVSAAFLVEMAKLKAGGDDADTL